VQFESNRLGNVVMVSNGAARMSTEQAAAAAWAMFSVTSHITVVAAGGRLLQPDCDSMSAETTALEIAIAAVLKLSRGYEDLVPHHVDTFIEAEQYLQDKIYALRAPFQSHMGI